MTIITKRFCCLLLGLAIWFAPVPVGLVPQAWHLFAIFAAVIFTVIIGAMPIVLASVVGLVASIMSGTLQPEEAYGGFSNGLILLIGAAFLVGRGVVNSGLGHRLAYMLVRSFGSSSLGFCPGYRYRR